MPVESLFPRLEPLLPQLAGLPFSIDTRRAAVMARALDAGAAMVNDVSALTQDPAALPRLRAQMLRRIQVVLGEGKVRDLLVTEFVLN